MLRCIQLFCDPTDCSLLLLCPWDSPDETTEVGSHALLQVIFPIHALQAESLPLRHQESPAAAAAKSLQLCPTLCDPIELCGSPPASPIPGILQARTLEWVAISFSNA